MTLPLQVFYVAGIVAAVVLAILLVLTLIGADHHDLADHPDGGGVLSIRTIVGFFFGFGWTGALALRSGFGLPAALGLALLVGCVFLFGIYLLMRALFSLRESGTLDYKNAVGQTATVYVTIPPERRAGGQIEVLIQGRLQTMSALTGQSEPLVPGTKVRVISQVDQGTVEVQPF